MMAARVQAPSAGAHDDYFYSLDDHILRLPHGALELLGQRLSFPSPGHDWRALADRLQCRTDLILTLSLEGRDNPGLALLLHWGRSTPGATLRMLRNNLRSMSRADLVQELIRIMYS